jgi:hypothetical protein
LAHELAHVVQQSRVAARTGAELQRQRAAGRITREHEPRAPSLRPTNGEVVWGFPLTRVHCSCGAEVDREERRSDRAIAAYAACQRKGIQSVGELVSCVRHAIFGPNLADVPAAAEAEPETSEIKWPTREERRKRAEMLNRPEFGPCVPLLWWSTLTHETEHLEHFEEIAAELGPEFLAEFNALTGDPKRIEKLSRRFLRQTQRYLTETYLSVGTRVKMEIRAYERAKRFLADVRAALRRICRHPRPARPTVERPLPERRGFQPKLLVNPLDDPYEREADEMAEWISRMPGPERRTDRSQVGKASRRVPQIQRQAGNESEKALPPRSGCECDCESYCGDVANRYARDHIKYPSWYGEEPEPIRVKLIGTRCFYQSPHPPPCSWVCTADFESNFGRLPVIVQLMSSRRFNVGTVDTAFPLCSYDFECDKVLTLSEVGCIERQP